MAAYAALVSLMHIVDQIEHHPRPPVFLDQRQVESLTKKVTFLQDFLEDYSHGDGSSSNEADVLESRIANAAHAAEDIIESHIVDQIHAGSTSRGESNSSVDFYEGLQKVIDDMDFIMIDVMEIKEKTPIQDHLHRNSMPADSQRSSFEENIMVGFDDFRTEIMDKLTGQQPNRQVIPIVGMGGIGKTTLARNVYLSKLIQQHFDVCAWTTISQSYNTREILREVLVQVDKEGGGDRSELSENELGERLHKCLLRRRYLIVMDDMWSTEAWDKVSLYFPNSNKGSRIVITTRLSNLAIQLTDSYWLPMQFLDTDKSRNLLCKTVFGTKVFPLELEEIGEKIVKGCRGLPLSIVVIGGLLAKSKHKREFWEYIAENINSVVNLENDEHCLKILYMSYNQLPVYLKPCFLYMGIFPEDNVIRVSMLIKLWVAEGFLKPIVGKSLEVVARKYFMELIDRNLILIHELGCTGNIKYCNIHDILRDMCLREAQKDGFYTVIKQHSLNVPERVKANRNIVVPEWHSTEEKFPDALQSMSLARSFICYSRSTSPQPIHFRLLRILKAFDKDFGWRHRFSLENMYDLVNLRYIAITADSSSMFSSSVYHLWNLHTLIVNIQGGTAPPEIWKMPQLRHVKFYTIFLPDPLGDDCMDGNDFILGNLQTLSAVGNFKCSDLIVKKIPNIKKLRVYYGTFVGTSHYFLNNLERLSKLESFNCSCNFLFSSELSFLKKLTFPHSLKKLTIHHFRSEDILEKIGSLPLLEKLVLTNGKFKDCEWETIEGQFSNLKFLRIESCSDLKYWMTDSANFPRLERLVLSGLEKLEEIPPGIGETPTLQSINLRFCSDSAVISAKHIQVEQGESGNEDLQVRVAIRLFGRKSNRQMKGLASPKFHVEYC